MFRQGFFRDKGTKPAPSLSPSSFLLLIHDRRFDAERINQDDITPRIHQLAIIVIIANVCR